MTSLISTDSERVPACWIDIIRADYREVPGLRLTLPQARRFWGLDESTSVALFGELVASRFLTRTQAGAYVRTAAY